MERKIKIYLIILIFFYLLGIAVATVALKEVPYFTAVAFAFFVAAGILVYLPVLKRRFAKVVVWSILVAIWLALWAYAIINKLP